MTEPSAGAVAAAVFARFACRIYPRPRPLGWEPLALALCVCLGAAACFLLPVTAGLLPNRRRGR